MRTEGAGDLALRLALIQVSAVGAAPTDLQRIISGNPSLVISVEPPAIVPQTHEVEL